MSSQSSGTAAGAPPHPHRTPQAAPRLRSARRWPLALRRTMASDNDELQPIVLPQITAYGTEDRTRSELELACSLCDLQGADPLAYLHGQGNIIPGLEKALAAIGGAPMVCENRLAETPPVPARANSSALMLPVSNASLRHVNDPL